MAENTEKPVPVPVDLFVGGDPHRHVQVAGLLAHDPELVGALKTPTGWQRALDAYLKTPIDATE